MKLETKQRWERICHNPDYNYVIEILNVLPFNENYQAANCVVVQESICAIYCIGTNLYFDTLPKISENSNSYWRFLPNQNKPNLIPKVYTGNIKEILQSLIDDPKGFYISDTSINLEELKNINDINQMLFEEDQRLFDFDIND